MAGEIPKTMRAVVYRGVDDLRVETLPVPRTGPGELLVKVAACGVCPTDIKKIHYGTLPPPRVFGHETAGTIVRVGARVRGVRVGDRVALHHHVPCLECHACRHRAFAQCRQYKRTGITAGFEPAGGGFAEYVRVMSFVLPGVVKIPRRNSFLEGAMQEPVNTVLKAVNRLALLPGDTVLVAGQGPIGLMFTRLLALRGMNVIASDLLLPRLKLARHWGASHTILNRGRDAFHSVPDLAPHRVKGRGPKTIYGTEWNPSLPYKNVVGTVSTPSQTFPRRGVDAAVLTVGSNVVFQQARELVRGGGQVLLFAHTQRGVETKLDLSTVCMDEKDLIGSYSADFTLQKQVADCVFSRKLDVRQLVTHQFPLEQTAAAVELAAKPTPKSLKVMVMQ